MIIFPGNNFSIVHTGITKFFGISQSSLASEGTFLTLQTSRSVVQSNVSNPLVLSSLKYYPNPSNGKLTIESKQILEEITIYNLLGEKVMQIQPNSLNCDLSTEYLTNGVYKAKVKTINRIEVFKLIVKK